MSSDSTDPLQVSLLLGSRKIPSWFAQSLEYARSNASIEFSRIIIADTPDEDESKSVLEDIAEKRSWIFVAGLQKLCSIRSNSSGYDNMECIGKVPCLQNVPIQHTIIENSGKYYYEFPSNTANQVSECSDVAIHFGIGILQGDILRAPSLGVIGYHHGDIQEYRGGPPGFWEFIDGKPTTGVTIQRFTETLDGGEILAFKSVNIVNSSNWNDVRKLQYEASVPLLAEALRNLSDSSFEPEVPDELGEIYTPSQRNLQTVFRYVWKVLINKLDRYKSSL